MIRLLQWLFAGHVHKWETLERLPLYPGNNRTGLPHGIVYIQQCKHCGNVKRRTLDQ